MECSICQKIWNDEITIPRTLMCGHSICQECLIGSWIEDYLSCPVCNSVQEFSLLPDFDEDQNQFRIRAVSSLPKNFTLLSIVQEQSGIKRCPSHNLLIHSYTVLPYSLVCDSCIQDLSELNLEIKPIPEIINKTRKNLEMSLTTFRSLMVSLKDIYPHELPLGEASQGLENHFSSLLSSVDKSWSKAMKKLKEVPSENLKTLEQASRNLVKEKIELENLRNTLNCFQSLPEEEMAQHYDEIENISLLRIQKSKDNISPFNMSVKVDESVYGEIESLVRSSFTFDNNPKAWACENCRQMNIDGEFICLKCEQFRPIHTYPNVLKQPDKVTEQEINELKKRREMEIRIFRNASRNFSSNSDHYIVSVNWQNDWKNFLYNVYQSYLPLASPNPRIGMLPPGSVSNHLLYANIETQEFLGKLQPGIDYRGVNIKTWELYMKHYGGGPEIIRRKMNIYD